MYKLLIPLLFLMYSCRTVKSSSRDKSDDKLMDTVINETMKKLKDSGIIK